MLIKIKKYIFDRLVYKISIKRRLILYFILSVLIPTTLISTTIYVRSTEIITEKIDSSIQKNMITTEAIIQQKIDSAKDLSTLIIFNLNSGVINMLGRPRPSSSEAVINEITALDEIVSNYSLLSISDLSKVTIFPRIYMINRPEYSQYNFSDKVFDIGRIADKQWVAEFPKELFAFVGLDKIRIADVSLSTLKFAREVYNLKNPLPSYSGILTMDLEVKYFNDILDSLKSSAGSSVFIVDDTSNIILSNNPSWVGMNLNEVKEVSISNEAKDYNSYIKKVEGRDILVSVKSIGSLKWNMVALSPLNELNEELVSFRDIVFVVLAICMCLSFITALFLAGNIAKPIQKLVKSMSHIKDGNFEINLVYKRNDEFTFLVNEYKRMINEIKQLIDRLYVSELEKQNAELKVKDAELKTLQAQINPHFLYNTLDSVNWLAIKYKAPDISTMVKSLSNFFRYSLNKGGSIILWENEIKQVESYLQIQKIRFREKLEYCIDVSDEILSSYTVKLILQPIVENAIIHGIEKSMEEGQIKILGTADKSMIEIKISDNGIGADTERLNKLLEDEKSTASFGLKNVNLRIKQFFGNEYGLKFHTNEECGVTVTVTVPVVKELEGRNA